MKNTYRCHIQCTKISEASLIDLTSIGDGVNQWRMFTIQYKQRPTRITNDQYDDLHKMENGILTKRKRQHFGIVLGTIMAILHDIKQHKLTKRKKYKNRFQPEISMVYVNIKMAASLVEKKKLTKVVVVLCQAI